MPVQALQSLAIFVVHPGLLLLLLATVLAAVLGLLSFYGLLFRRRPRDLRVGMVIIAGLVSGALGWLHYTLDLNLENAPLQASPENGDIALYRTLDPKIPTAPFRVTTNTEPVYNGYFVKVSDWATSEPLLAMYVRGGQDAEVPLPIGSYRVMVARGPNWYGMDRLFGKKTIVKEELNPVQIYQNGPGQTTGVKLHLFNGKSETTPLN